MSSLRMLLYLSDTLIFRWLKSLVVDWCVACRPFFSFGWSHGTVAFGVHPLQREVSPRMGWRCLSFHRPWWPDAGTGQGDNVAQIRVKLKPPGWQVYGEPMGNGCSGCNGCNGCGCGGCNGYGAQMYEDLGFNGYVPQHAYYQERGLGIFFRRNEWENWKKFVQVGWWNVTVVCILDLNWRPNDRRTWRWPTWITACRKEMYNHRVLILKYSGGFKSLEACKAWYSKPLNEPVFFGYFLVSPRKQDKKTNATKVFSNQSIIGYQWLIKIAVDRSMIHKCSAGFLGQPLVNHWSHGYSTICINRSLHQSIYEATKQSILWSTSIQIHPIQTKNS